MFGMGAGELILILVLVLLIFGPKKLPDLAKGIGKALREFRRASTDLQSQISLDHELGDAVREVQAAASGAPSPAELETARKSRELATPPERQSPAKPVAAAAETPPPAAEPAPAPPAATTEAATSPAAVKPPKSTPDP